IQPNHQHFVAPLHQHLPFYLCQCSTCLSEGECVCSRCRHPRRRLFTDALPAWSSVSRRILLHTRSTVPSMRNENQHAERCFASRVRVHIPPGRSLLVSVSIAPSTSDRCCQRVKMRLQISKCSYDCVTTLEDNFPCQF